MVWLTWRQHRLPVVAAVAFAVAAGGFLLLHAGGTASDAVLTVRFGEVAWLLRWSVLVPAAIGVFLGAPLLAAEYEHGTHRLAWTQSVHRPAWLGVKLAVLGTSITAAGLVFGLSMYTWAGAFAPLPSAGRLANEDLFTATGVVPAAWWLFAFAVGTATGAVLRRLLPAVATTLVLFFVVYIGMFTTDARLHYAPPAHVERPEPVVEGKPWLINTPAGATAQLPPGALLVTAGWTDRAGTPLTHDETWSCPTTSGYLPCMRDKGYRWSADYHPADRYWRFQLTEAALLLAASLALGALTWRRIYRGVR